MFHISQPIRCPNCGKEMVNYEVKNAEKKVIFRCKCKCVHIITFDEYKQELRNKYQIK